MPATAFVIGFFTALGWWSAYKLTGVIDKNPLDKNSTPTQIEQRTDK